MVHRVYMCSNLKSTLVVQEFVQVEGCNNNNHILWTSPSFVLKKQVNFQEGEQYLLQYTTCPPTNLKPRMVCSQEVEDDEDMTSSDLNHLATTFQDDDKVSSFICTINNSKNRLLPNDINMTRNYGEDHKIYKDSHIGEKGQQRTSKPSWRPNTSQVRVLLGIQE